MNRSEISLTAMFNVKEFERSNQTLQRQMRQSARQMKAIGQQMTMALSLPITLGLGAAVKEFATFELNMAKVKAVSGATEQEFEGLKNTAEELGRTTKFTAQEVADLELQYSKLGFSASEIQKITKATLDLALVTDEELGRSAMVAGSTLRGFNLEGEEMARVVDVMAASFTSSALDLEKWYVSTSKIAPIASVMGVSLEKVAAQQSALADAGIEASIIGTQLRQIYGELAKSGMTYNEAMEKISGSIDKSSTAINLFDKRAAAAAIILAEQSEKVNRLEKSYENAKGAAEEMGKIVNDTLLIDLQELQSAIENIAIKFGEVLAPTIRSMADGLTNVAGTIANLSPATKIYVVALASMMAIIPPIVSMLGSLSLALMTYGKSMRFAWGIMGKFLLVGAAVVTVIQGISWYIKKEQAATKLSAAIREQSNRILAEEEGFRERINKLKIDGSEESQREIKLLRLEAQAQIQRNKTIKQETQARRDALLFQIQQAQMAMRADANLRGVVPIFATLFNKGFGVSQTLELDKMFNTLKNLDASLNTYDAAIQGVEDGIKDLDLRIKIFNENLINTNKQTQKEVDLQKQAVKQLKEKKSAINSILSDTKKTQSAISKKFADDFSLSFGFDSPDMAENINSGINKFAETVTEAANNLDFSKVFVEPMETLYDSFKDNWQMTMVNGVSQLIGDFATGIGEMLSGAMTPKDFGREMLVQVASFIQQLGGLLIVYGAGMSALLNSMSAPNPATALAAIAGGAAMVAAGAAIKGALSKGLDGGSGGMMGYGGSRATTGMGNQDFTSEIRIQGREMIIVQRRESGFRR